MNTAKKKARFIRKRKSPSADLLTKQILSQAAQAAFKEAAATTMAVMGYNAVVHEGWVVKKYQDGRIEKISKLEPVNRNRPIVLN